VKSREGNKILCEKRGVVEMDYSCSKYVYSPLKRIPVKQLNIHGAFDDDIEEETALEDLPKK
jgi:succinate dehydrogenase flavin-adding protein (antitoxin of CptAB toxin-antitoxin module)